MLEVAVATCSEPGQRASNEDSVRVAHRGARWIAVLADGAGGHVGGAEASRHAVEALLAVLGDAGAEFSAQWLTRAVRSAHARVRRAQGDVEGMARMHSTVVALWIDTERQAVLWSHVGDSRLYLARPAEVRLLTVDDSVVQRLLEAGLLTPEQAEVHPHRNQLIAALGTEDDVQPHTLEQPVPLRAGDAYLLCSDGWWGALDPAALGSTLAAAASPLEWLASMQRRIEQLDRPRQDNFSAIGVWVDDPAEATRPPGRLGPA